MDTCIKGLASCMFPIVNTKGRYTGSEISVEKDLISARQEPDNFRNNRNGIPNRPKNRPKHSAPFLQIPAETKLFKQELKQWVNSGPNKELHQRQRVMEQILWKREGKAEPENFGTKYGNYSSDTLDLRGTYITSLPDCLHRENWILNITDANLHSLPRLPPNLQQLTNISINASTLPGLPSSLQTLKLTARHLEKLPELPSSLQTLELSAYNLKNLPSRLPDSLVILILTNHNLTMVPDLPINLKEFVLKQDLRQGIGEITALPKELPSTLVRLVVDKAPLTVIPELPLGLQELNISNSYLRFLPELPTGLLILNMSENQCLTRIPTLPPKLNSFNAYNTGLFDSPAGLQPHHDNEATLGGSHSNLYPSPPPQLMYGHQRRGGGYGGG
jgi:hypothetical protein